MASTSVNPAEGHRSRLRQRFSTDTASLTETELLELLLTFAIPRQDTSATAATLIQHFGDLTAVMNAGATQLLEIEGVGDRTAALLQLVAVVSGKMAGTVPFQPLLLDEIVVDLFPEKRQPIEQEEESQSIAEPESGENDGELRAFVNDEVLHSQEYLPEAHRFSTLDDFRSFLVKQLPYNAAATRQRRANHILNRFFPNGSLDISLVEFLRQTTSAKGRDSAIFYGLVRGEPLLLKVAEELIWPALANGRVTREEMRTFILGSLPTLSKSSQVNVLRSILTAYSQLGIATIDNDTLQIQLHPGDLDGFIYGLSAEFPQPGIYRFDTLEKGLLRKGLLWDAGWMRRQLYLLETAGIIAKVSEIDAVRQFTLRYTPKETLRAYFALGENALAILRESSEGSDSEYTLNETNNG
jgi:hypothetical protein